ncbi:zinc finger BED domain-containing protein 5-like [Tachypleus tridentatus]|uniref:zinc finger BED domain-containing protein 5-like n=1 Tax=Tachypleus tridentatus TaxID=6853 RepID=UPI003FD16502
MVYRAARCKKLHTIAEKLILLAAVDKLHEATDSNKDAHLIYNTRLVDDDKVVEDLLFCKSITAGTKGQDLFEILDTFICENNLHWTKCVGTGGGHSISGCYGRLQALIRSKTFDAL